MYLLLTINVLAIFTQCLSFGVEPKCSRFHYEEQLLEKMIRMEIKFEEIEKRVSKTSQNVISVLEDLKIERTNIKNDSNELQVKVEEFENRISERNQIVSNVLEDLKTERTNLKNDNNKMQMKVEEIEKRIFETNQNVSSVLKDLETERTNLKNGNNEWQMNYTREMEERMKNLKALVLTDTVAFKAGGPTDLSPKTGQTIVFANDILNTGGAYNTKTGIFTAPVGGIYIFMIHLCLKGSKSMFYGIMVGETVYTSGHVRVESYVNCHTAHAIVVLSGGEMIYVKCLYGYPGDILHEYTSSGWNSWSTFSGLLVHR